MGPSLRGWSSSKLLGWYNTDRSRKSLQTVSYGRLRGGRVSKIGWLPFWSPNDYYYRSRFYQW